MDLRHDASRTPSKRRAFGSQLSVNTPLPLLRQDQHRQPPLSKSIQKQKPLTSVKKKKKNATPIIFHDDAEARRCASERKFPATTTTTTTMERSPNIDLESNINIASSLSSSPLFTPASNDRGRSDGVRMGRNLIDNFNSPSTANNDINNSNSNRLVSFSPKHSVDAEKASWTKFTPKIEWRKDGNPDESNHNDSHAPAAPSSSANSSNIELFSPMNTRAKEMMTPFPKLYASSPLSTMPTSSPQQPSQSRIHDSKFPAQQLSTHTETFVPTSFAMQQLSVTTNNEMFSIAEDVSIGPSEYAIRFPVNGDSLLHLEFEPVTITSGRPTGCGIAKILPGFEKSNACYLTPHTGVDGSSITGAKEVAIATPTKTKMTSLIQVNDLIVSINGVSVLSRKYDFIMEVLLQKFKNDDKIIVFRSIEKIWRSRSNGGNQQFSTWTMRNIRTGRRVATALNDAMMDDDLHSWVKTPTQVALGRRRGVVNGADNEDQLVCGSTAFFSPSNIKQISIRKTSASNYQSRSPPSSSSRSPSRPQSTSVGVVEPLAVTVKKCNTRNSKNQYLYERSGGENMNSIIGEIAISPAHITLERIGKALTGEGIRGDKGSEFERSLRLKKDLLDELKNVHSELEGWSQETSEKEQILADHAAIDKMQLSNLQSQVDELKSERFATLQTMIDMQAQLEDAKTKVQEINKLETVNSELLLSNKKLEKTIAVIQSDRDAACEELENERSASSELTKKLADAVENGKTVSGAFDAEKLSSSHRAVSHAEQVRTLEERLAEKEQKARESSIAHLSIVAELKKRITVIESERDCYHLDLERGRLALTVSESERDGIAADLDRARSIIEKVEKEKMEACTQLIELEAKVEKLQDENRLLMSDLAAEKSSTIQLMSQVEQYASNLNTVELEKKECLNVIANLIDEKERVEYKLKETATSLESSINENFEKSAALNGIIASSKDQEKIFNDQVSTLMEANIELDQKVKTTTATLSAAEKTASAERMKFHERDAIHVEHVRCLEERLISEAKCNLEKTEEIAALETQLVAMQSDCESTRNELEKERLALKDQLSEAEREYSRRATECQDLEREIHTLRNSKSQQSNVITSLNGRIGELEHDCESNHSVIDNLLADCNLLRDEVAQKDILQSELNSLSLALEDSQLALSNATRDRGLLKERVDDLVRELAFIGAKRKDDQDSYEQRLFVYEKEIAGLKASLAAAECANTYSVAEISDKESSLVSLRADFDRSKKELVAKNCSLTHLLELKTAEIGAIQSSNKSLTEQITHVSNDIKENQIIALNEKEKLSAQLILLSTKINDMENDRKTNDSHFIDLVTKLQTAEELLDEGDEEIQRLNHDCQKLEKQVEQAHLSLQNAEEIISELRCENESLLQVKKSLTHELNSKANELLERERELKHQHDDNLEKLRESTNEATKHKKIVTDITSKLHYSEESLAEAQNEMNALVAELARMSSTSEDLRSEKEAINNQLIESKNEAIENADKVADLTSKLHSSEASLAKTQDEMKKLSAKLTSMSSTADSLRSENEAILIQRAELTTEAIQNDDNIADLTSKWHSSEESLAEAQDEIKALVDELTSMSSTAEGLCTEKEELVKQLAESKDKFTQNKHVVSDLTSKLHSSEESLAVAQHEMKAFVAKLARLSSTADDHRSENEALLNQLAESKDKATHNEEKVIDLTSELHFSEASLSEAQDKIKELIAKLASMSSTAEGLRTEKEELVKQLAESEDKATRNDEFVSDLTSKLHFSEETLAEESDKMKALVSKLASASSTADDLRSEKETLLNQLAELKDEATHDKGKVADLTSKLHSSEESLAEAHDEMKELVAKLAIMSSTAEDFRTEKEERVKQLAESKVKFTQNEHVLSDLTSKLHSSEESLAVAQHEMKAFVAKLASMSSTADDLRSENEALLNQLAESKDKVTHNEEKVIDLTSELHSSEASLSEAQDKMKELIAKLASMSSTADDLRSDNEALLNQLAEFEDKNTQNEDKVSDLTSKLHTSEASLAVAQDEIKALVSKFASASSTVDDLRSANDSSLVQVQNLQFRIKYLFDMIYYLIGRENIDEGCSKSSQIEFDVEIKISEMDHIVNENLYYFPMPESEYSSDNCVVTRTICHESCQLGFEMRDFGLLLRNLECTLRHLKDEKLSVESELLSAIRSLNQLQSEKESITADLELKTVEIIGLNDFLKNVVSSGESDKSELATKLTSLEMDLVSVKATLESKHAENFSLLQQLRESKSIFDDLTTEIRCAESQYQIQIECSENRMKELLQQNEVLSTTIQKLSERDEELEAQSLRELLSHELSTKQDSIYIRNLQNSLSGSELKHLHLMNELDALKSEKESKESYFLKALQEKDSHLESIAITVKTMENEIARLENCVESAEKVISSLTSEGNATKDSMKVDLDNARESHKDTRDSMTAHIQRLQSELNLCQQALSQTEGYSRDREVSLVSELSAAKQEERDLRKQVNEVENLLNTIETTKESTKDQIRRLQEDLELCVQSLSQERDLSNEKEVNLVSELSIMKQREHDLLEQVKENERLLIASQENCDLRHIENCKLRQLTLKLSADLQAQKDEICHLKQMLEEEIALNCSLSESSKRNERTVHEQSIEIEQLRNELKLVSQSSILRESELTRKLDELTEEIIVKQMTIELHISENNALVKRIGDNKMTQTELRSKLDAVYRELACLSRMFACARTGIADEISSAKTTAEEFINRVLMKSNKQKSDFRHQIEALEKELERKQIQSHKMLSLNDEETRALADTNTSKAQLLEAEINTAMRDLSILTSKNADLELFIQQQEESISKVNLANENEIGRLQGECYVATKKLELATIKLDREKSLYDRKIASLQATIQEKCLLNRCLAARLEVASLSSHRADEIGVVTHTKEDELWNTTCEARDNSIKKLSTDLSLVRHKIVALESECQEAHDQNEKLGSRYEKIVAEMEACREHTVDLKAVIIDKNKEIELKEGAIMELQYTVDFLEAQADGWKMSSLTKPGIESEQWKFSSDDVADIMTANATRHAALSADFAKLEEKCSRMEEDIRQRTSVHEAIVEGLESECKSLFREIDDFQTDLQEKQIYIASLEEAKTRLENEFNVLMTDRDDAYRNFSELQNLCNKLQQEKEAAETLTSSLISAARKLAYAAIDQGSKLDGFPINSISLSSWSENMDTIAHFIEHASRSNQKQIKVIAPSQICYSDATPPRSEGGSSLVNGDLVSQHYEVLEGLKRMKQTIASAMASPRLTPIKSSGQGEGECHDDLYTDLLKAHEQLDSLSLKIRSYQDDQTKWKEWETYYECRIAELESENQIMKAAALPEAPQEAKMKVISAVMIHTFQHCHRRSVLQRAFQDWVSQTRMSKHVVIVKDMAKELAMTRKKVLLLKSHMEDNS